MRTIRIGTFETNSSSTHSLTVVPESEFSLIDVDNMFIDGDELITRDEAIFRLKKRAEYRNSDIDFDNDDEVNEAMYWQFKRWRDVDNFNHHFVSPSGDRMVVYGWYGSE